MNTKIPTTDDEAKSAIIEIFCPGEALPDLPSTQSSDAVCIAFNVYGLYRCARGQGATVVDAYKDALSLYAAIATSNQ